MTGQRDGSPRPQDGALDGAQGRRAASVVAERGAAARRRRSGSRPLLRAGHALELASSVCIMTQWAVSERVNAKAGDISILLHRSGGEASYRVLGRAGGRLSSSAGSGAIGWARDRGRSASSQRTNAYPSLLPSRFGPSFPLVDARSRGLAVTFVPHVMHFEALGSLIAWTSRCTRVASTRT